MNLIEKTFLWIITIILFSMGCAVLWYALFNEDNMIDVFTEIISGIVLIGLSLSWGNIIYKFMTKKKDKYLSRMIWTTITIFIIGHTTYTIYFSNTTQTIEDYITMAMAIFLAFFILRVEWMNYSDEEENKNGIQKDN